MLLTKWGFVFVALLLEGNSQENIRPLQILAKKCTLPDFVFGWNSKFHAGVMGKIDSIFSSDFIWDSQMVLLTKWGFVFVALLLKEIYMKISWSAAKCGENLRWFVFINTAKLLTDFTAFLDLIFSCCSTQRVSIWLSGIIWNGNFEAEKS